MNVHKRKSLFCSNKTVIERYEKYIHLKPHVHICRHYEYSRFSVQITKSLHIKYLDL